MHLIAESHKFGIIIKLFQDLFRTYKMFIFCKLYSQHIQKLSLMREPFEEQKRFLNIKIAKNQNILPMSKLGTYTSL